jgi:hypothetical protein
MLELVPWICGSGSEKEMDKGNVVVRWIAGVWGWEGDGVCGGCLWW